MDLQQAADEHLIPTRYVNHSRHNTESRVSRPGIRNALRKDLVEPSVVSGAQDRSSLAVCFLDQRQRFVLARLARRLVFQTVCDQELDDLGSCNDLVESFEDRCQFGAKLGIPKLWVSFKIMLVVQSRD